MEELCNQTAIALRQMIDRREISAVEVTEAHLRQIDSINPTVNAIVTLVPDHALTLAEAVDQRLARGDHPGLLAGLPTAHKDLLPTAGIRTTFGSRLFADNVPDQNALIVQRQLDAGAITLGKTNTPEWGAGSQTFNDVFGATVNPWDTRMTCGGSSGGAAAALAARLVPVADGSDMGGSLRNPASFCHVVGFRASSGRVPEWPALNGYANLAVPGSMARNVSDCALLLAAIAGEDVRCPISLPGDGDVFLPPLDRDVAGTRIAWSPDFGGQLPVEDAVQTVIQQGVTRLAEMGCHVEAGCPDLSGADDVFKTLRAASFAARHGEGVRTQPDMYKDTIIWNAQAGLELSAVDIARAEQQRTAIYQRVVAFMQSCDFLVLPVTQVPPFPVTQEYVTDIAGVAMDTYIDWMKSCYFITVTGLPALSVPCGFTDQGLPVGLQIVGRPGRDREVLEMGYAFEQAMQVVDISPDFDAISR